MPTNHSKPLSFPFGGSPSKPDPSHQAADSKSAVPLPVTPLPAPSYHLFIQAFLSAARDSPLGSYERLEFFGDAWLKLHVISTLYRSHPQALEGQIVRATSALVSNDRLCSLALRRGLHEYILSVLMVTKGERQVVLHPALQPKLRPARAGVEVKQPLRTLSTAGRSLSSKAVADVVEDVIGACYLIGGDKLSLTFLQYLGFQQLLTPVVTPTQDPPATSTAASPSASSLPSINPMSVPATDVKTAAAVSASDSPLVLSDHKAVSEMLALKSAAFDRLETEKLAGYRFRDRSLLLEAFTHASAQVVPPRRCYERLELLGDAVLGFLVTQCVPHPTAGSVLWFVACSTLTSFAACWIRYQFDEFPALPPGRLCLLRAAAVCNQTFAEVALQHKLYTHMEHTSFALAEDLRASIERFEEAQREAAVSGPSGVMTSPFTSTYCKVLGDVVESLAGAVYVDCGYDLAVVWRHVVSPLLGATLREHARPERVIDHSTSVLMEWSAKRGCPGLAYSYVGPPTPLLCFAAHFCRLLLVCDQNERRWKGPKSAGNFAQRTARSARHRA